MLVESQIGPLEDADWITMNIKDMKASIAIFEKYVPEDVGIFHGEHDTLYGPDFDGLSEITPEDRKSLEALGWYEGDADRWQRDCSC